MGTSLEMLPAGTEQLSSEEEGEIIELDDDDNEFDYRSPANAPATAAIDFEDISSDEELNLRQRIEELEARNQELEQIAAITKAADDFGKFRIHLVSALLFHQIATTPMRLLCSSTVVTNHRRR